VEAQDQDQTLRTNVIKVKIDKQESDVRCRMCKDREENSRALNE